MTDSPIDLAAGRSVFGRDAAGYAIGRLNYPDELYNLLQRQCGLGAGTQVFEVGPGTGQATRELIARGATVTAIEPDRRLAELLRQVAGEDQLAIDVCPFEQANLPDAQFDLGVAATSFGWLDRAAALSSITKALRPGGWWAMWWNLFRAIGEDRIFDEATRDLPRPQAFTSGEHYALNTAHIIGDLRAAGFLNTEFVEITRDVSLTPSQFRALYATFSPIRLLSADEREERLAVVEAIASEEAQDGRVTKSFLTLAYISKTPEA